MIQPIGGYPERNAIAKPRKAGIHNKTALLTAILTLTFALFTNNTTGQVNDQSIRLKVLQKGIVDKTFIFGKWTKDGGMETHLKYLGGVTTRRGQTFKILNSTWIWGLSQRATSRILVYNDRNQYIGNYYVTVISDLPTSLKSGKLIFKNTEESCDKNVVTVINLKDGLPRQFFRKCSKEGGDIYSFVSN